MPPQIINKKKIVNIHTHCFTGDYVPPFLAKTFLPFGLYHLIHTGFFISVCRFYYRIKNYLYFEDSRLLSSKKKLKKIYIKIPKALRSLIFYVIFLNTLFYLIEITCNQFSCEGLIFEKVFDIKSFLKKYFVYFEINYTLKWIWVLLVLFFLRSIRRAMLSIIKLIFPVLKKILPKDTVKLISRYYHIGRFSFYETQKKIAERALHQLPPNSSIVLLPMDMKYMGAGKTKISKKNQKDKLKKGWKKTDIQDSFRYQMREIWDFTSDSTNKLKDDYYPFLFVDPRRVKEENKTQNKFFDYKISKGKIVLKDCFVKTYIEDRNFSGFKIYPALGYYPFDEELLPIWLYAAQNHIPIMAHCVMGTIFYRGKKKSKWNYHPIFKDEDDEQLFLPQQKNIDFQRNFTHPMNYLCLLEDKFLIELLSKNSVSNETRQAFGYSEKGIARNLNNLKICFAHYGGEEEWIKYLEADRNVYSQRLIRDPEEGIKFMQNTRGKFSIDKIRDLWNICDWYSIISSMMIRYNHVYADLSYILSKESIYPLLKDTLEKNDNHDIEYQNYLNELNIHNKTLHFSGKNKLRSRVLFGTDFYVVRNHKSDKDLFVYLKNHLGIDDFDLIARDNNYYYLTK